MKICDGQGKWLVSDVREVFIFPLQFAPQRFRETRSRCAEQALCRIFGCVNGHRNVQCGPILGIGCDCFYPTSVPVPFNAKIWRWMVLRHHCALLTEAGEQIEFPKPRVEILRLKTRYEIGIWIWHGQIDFADRHERWNMSRSADQYLELLACLPLPDDEQFPPSFFSREKGFCRCAWPHGVSDSRGRVIGRSVATV